MNDMQGVSEDIGPTYHDFSWLGLPTRQIEGIYAPNQRAKAPVIAAYILLAFARLRCAGQEDIMDSLVISHPAGTHANVALYEQHQTLESSVQ